MLKKVVYFLLFQIFFGVLLGPFLVFWGPFDALKGMAVGAIVTSRHPRVASIWLTPADIERIMNKSQEEQPGAVGTEVQKTVTQNVDGIQIEDIKGRGWKGKVMLIKDPSRVIVACTGALGASGQRVTELVKSSNTVAGINAGGFTDPNGTGNGAFPMGITLSQGKLVHNDGGNKPQDMIGLDSNGKLIVGSMTLAQLQAKGVRDAVSFFPALVTNGRGVVKGDGGWGPGPRTGIGQKADGTILLVVIDGRQLQSLGATLRDLQNVFLEYGAVTAANLDGGSSTTMVYNGEVIDKPADIFGERYVPTAFVVKP